MVPSSQARSSCLPILVALASALALAGCGGGGSGASLSSTPGPAPVTPPTPPQTPPPPPTATVSPFPSASPPTYYTTVHATVNAKVTTGPSPNGTQKVTGLTNTTFVGMPSLGNIEYRATDTYLVEFYGMGGLRFDPDEKVASSDVYEQFHDFAWDPYFGNLQLARRDRGIQFTYLTFGSVFEGIDSPTHGALTFFAAGSETPVSMMPQTGSASYSGIADGLWIDGGVTRRLYGSTATLTANFGTGQVTSSLNLRGLSDPFGDFTAGQATPLGLFTGTASISGAGFAGNYAASAGYSGPFTGRFSGPAAEEYGLAFRLNGGTNQTVVGMAVGKK